MGEAKLPWSSQEPCQEMPGCPGSLLSVGAVGERQGTGEPFSERFPSALEHTGFP